MALLCGNGKKAVELRLIDPDPELEHIRKYSALIRANFHIDPAKLSISEFSKLAAEAIWIENFRDDRKKEGQTELMASMLQMTQH